MKLIRLTNGMLASVDDADFELVRQFNWYPIVSKKKTYAQGCIDGKVLLMHQLLMPVDPPLRIDHKDGNSLNNCRSNLRPCTKSQNNQNRAKVRHSKTKSVFKGVCFGGDPGRKKPWRARIQVDGREINLGRFRTEVEAAMAYDAAAIRHFGEFARLNFGPPRAA